MTMQATIKEAEGERLFSHLSTAIPKQGKPAFELEGHIFGIVTRHASMRKTRSNGLGIIVAEDAQGRTFKIEISQVGGRAGVSAPNAVRVVEVELLRAIAHQALPSVRDAWNWEPGKGHMRLTLTDGQQIELTISEPKP